MAFWGAYTSCPNYCTRVDLYAATDNAVYRWQHTRRWRSQYSPQRGSDTIGRPTASCYRQFNSWYKNLKRIQSRYTANNPKNYPQRYRTKKENTLTLDLFYWEGITKLCIKNNSVSENLTSEFILKFKLLICIHERSICFIGFWWHSLKLEERHVT